MTKEVSDLLKKTDIRAVETQLALRCAPLLAGLKPSNLLILKNCQAQALYGLLQNTRFSSYELYGTGTETVLLLYADMPLACCLKQPEARAMLWQKGYRDFSLQALLAGFAARYASCRRSGGEFPHEMGLFLGYPPEDVRGFLENGGNNALYAGYWKVYQNLARKIRLFKSYDKAKACLVRLIAGGAGMAEVLNFYGGQ
ncbi:MAG: DUF3793 family protein [Eubacterium sp.]|nr:DUF3793 family protein [Eubacterium sp.]